MAIVNFTLISKIYQFTIRQCTALLFGGNCTSRLSKNVRLKLNILFPSQPKVTGGFALQIRKSLPINGVPASLWDNSKYRYNLRGHGKISSSFSTHPRAAYESLRSSRTLHCTLLYSAATHLDRVLSLRKNYANHSSCLSGVCGVFCFNVAIRDVVLYAGILESFV